MYVSVNKGPLPSMVQYRVACGLRLQCDTSHTVDAVLYNDTISVIIGFCLIGAVSINTI